MKACHDRRFVMPPAALGTLALAFGLVIASAAGAAITDLSVIPAHPTVADSVSIHVSGFYSDGCWIPGPVVCGSLVGNTIYITEHADDLWQPPQTACPLVILPYEGVCHYGLLPPGQYYVGFNETHSSQRQPDPLGASLIFTVSDATPVKPRSWGRLKMLYR